MDKQREAFEAMWIVKPERHPGADTYVDSFINVAWQNFTRGWQAALSHAEGETPFAWHRGGRAHEMLFADDLDGAPTDLSDGWEPLFKRPAPQVAVPEEREWNQAAGRDDLKYTEGWNACRDAMLAAAPTSPAPTKGEEIHVNVDGDSVYTLPLEPTGVAAPRFVVHVPAPTASAGESVPDLPDEREIAARPGYAGVTVWVGDQQCTQVVDRIVLETSRADELLWRFENARYLLRAGKEGQA